MGKNIVPVVKSQIPEFVKADHPQFQYFVEAYYEYLEKTSDSESSSVKDLFRNNPNAGALIANAQENRNLYDSIQTFLDYFAKELIPINISGNAVTDAFLLNKVRDLYLSKGTPKSFKLLFRLLYAEEIEVLEPRTRIIEASEGLYVQFSQMKAAVVANEEDLVDFNFELSTISLDTSLDSDVSDSENTEILTVIDATYDGVGNENQIILNLILTAVPGLNTKLSFGDEYNLRDAINLQKEVRIKVISHVNNVTIDSEGSGHRIGDTFTIRDQYSKVKVSVDQIGSGPIQKVQVRERGQNYSVGDTIEFINANSQDGTGAIASVTAVDADGSITEIDGTRLRTGVNHEGYLSDDFQPVAVPIIQGGVYTSIPKPFIRTLNGTGAEIDGWSSNVGRITSISVRDTGFFDSDRNGPVIIDEPFTIGISNVEEDIPLGSHVEFQYFDAEEENRSFKDDSEVLVVNFFRGYNADELRENETQYTAISEDGPWPFSNSITNDSEKLLEDDSDGFQWRTFYAGGDSRGIAYFKFPISYDSENFVFNYRTIKITDSDKDSDIIDKWVLDSEFNLRNVTYTYATGDSEGHKVRKFPVYIEDSEFYRLDNYHWNKVKNNNALKVSNSVITRSAGIIIGVQQYKIAELVYTTEKTLSIIEADSEGLYRSVGQWTGTTRGGIVISKSADNRNLTIIPRLGVVSSNRDSEIQFPTMESIDAYANQDYGILRLARINPQTGDVLTPETFPISNVIVSYDKPSVKVNMTLAALTEKQFVDESGFLSSVSGGVLRDNFTISEYAYILQTNTPMDTWRGKVKEILHPAGLYLFGELNVNSTYDVDAQSTYTPITAIEYEKGRMTFSDDDDYFDDAERNGIAVFSDTTVFEANPYNIVSYTNNASGVYLTADYTQQIAKNSIRSQRGNSYFDYEPVGLVHNTWVGFDSEKDYIEKANLVAAGDATAVKTYGHLFRTVDGVTEPNVRVIPFFEYTNAQTTQQFDSDIPEHRNIRVTKSSTSAKITTENAEYVSQSVRLSDSDHFRVLISDWNGVDSEFTLELYIRPDSDTTSESWILGITDSDESSYDYMLKLSDFDSDISTGNWHHIAYVRKSDGTDFYMIDGEVYTGGTGFSGSSTQNSITFGHGYKGLIAGVHLSNVARYDSDTKIHYTRPKPDTSSIAVFNFDYYIGNIDSDTIVQQPLKRGIKNASIYYKPNYGVISRTDGNTHEIGIAQVFFDDFLQYRAYDSEVPNDIFARFDAENTGMKSIDYTRFYDSRGDSDLVFKFPAIRRMDVLIDKQKDLNTAMKLDGSLKYEVGNITYTDFEAYEMKYNNFTANRDSDITNGYVIPGRLSDRLNISTIKDTTDSDSELNIGDSKYRLRTKLDVIADRAYEKSPRSSAAYGKYGDSDRESTIVVRQHYLNEINNTIQYIDRDSEVIDFLDLKRKY